ncbi:hypothetical protein HDU67_008076 [Dinochytrium kinnereticum]|nr:hypothetical protein HDU67_008076 [Dinochytrium kinnereticum]
MFSSYLGAVQYLQFRYQRKRLYVLVAMDMAAPMDTVSGDGAHMDRIERELLVLVPFLVFAQIWQVLATAVLFALLGAGNMITTLRTFLSKRRKTTSPPLPRPIHSSGALTPSGSLSPNTSSPLFFSATASSGAKRTHSAPLLAGMTGEVAGGSGGVGTLHGRGGGKSPGSVVEAVVGEGVRRRGGGGEE